MIDPVSAALIAAAVAAATSSLNDVSKTAVLDAYEALKAAIHKRFGAEHPVSKAVEAIDAKPTSKGRQETLIEEITDAGADQDKELLTLAEPIHLILEKQAKDNATVQQIISGNYNAVSVSGDASVTVQPPPKEQ